jgi:hypothetical protein
VGTRGGFFGTRNVEAAMDTVLLSPVLDSSAKDVKSPTREIDYKHHRIDVTVRSVNDGSVWKPDVYVIYSEDGKSVLRSLRIDQTFASPDEAEQTGGRLCEKVDR